MPLSAQEILDKVLSQFPVLKPEDGEVSWHFTDDGEYHKPNDLCQDAADDVAAAASFAGKAGTFRVLKCLTPSNAAVLLGFLNTNDTDEESIVLYDELDELTYNKDTDEDMMVVVPPETPTPAEDTVYAMLFKLNKDNQP